METFPRNQLEGKLIGRFSTQDCVDRLAMISYSSVRLLTGHGQFNKYLHELGVSDSSLCMYRDLVDTPDHTIFECIEYEELRKRYLDGSPVMLCKDGTAVQMNSWETVDFGAFCGQVWKKKDR